MLAMLFSLKTIESLKNGLQTHSGATRLFSMRAVSLTLLQSCRSVDSDAWYNWALRLWNRLLGVVTGKAKNGGASVSGLDKWIWLKHLCLHLGSTKYASNSRTYWRAKHARVSRATTHNIRSSDNLTSPWGGLRPSSCTKWWPNLDKVTVIARTDRAMIDVGSFLCE